MASLTRKSLIFYVVYLLPFIIVVRCQADCQSYGVDFFNGGGPYFINTASPDDFSFTTVFQGCTGETITPLLITPDTDEFFCSDIQTTPNGENMVSTCNVAGNEVPKSSMVSGTYTVIIEGLEFAWMRSFDIIVGVQSTVTATPTAVFNVTSTPVVNTTTTITQGYNSTLPAVTTTLPSVTQTKVSTITPSKGTTTSTNTKTITRISRSLTVTVVTKTKTVSCNTEPPKTDPTCTIHPKKLEASKAATASTVSVNKVKARNLTRDKRTVPKKVQRSRRLARRDADLPTTTVFETAYTATNFNSFTAPATTETYSTFTTTTNTITPAPVTVASGVTQVTSTTTLPTQTRVVTTQTVVTSTVTKVLTATITSISTVVPANGACTKL